MANINNLVSYELKGVKESFANWISNISPTDTPFVSMTGKESINNKYFQWQEDSLGAIDTNNAFAEGSDAASGNLNSTLVQKNVTQILRKVVQVSDTADALASYGRGSELAYQMEKAGAELKRDLEFAFLNNGGAVEGTGALGTGNSLGSASTAATLANSYPGQTDTFASTGAPLWNASAGGTFPGANQARRTAGFQSLVADKTTASPDSVGAGDVYVTHDASGVAAANIPTGQYGFAESDLFKLTADLYQVGANPNIIMFHPSQASTFSGLMESTGTAATRIRMFDGASDTQINTYVSTLVDPLGQEYKLVPNRFMPKTHIYIFDPADWTQMVLRAPQRTKLAKTGSYEKWMIEMEVGLRHRNRFASGVLKLVAGTK